MSGVTIWLTGADLHRSATVAAKLRASLGVAGRAVDLLTEEEVREHLCAGQPAEEDLAARRLGWLCEVLTRNGCIVVALSRSPRRALRDELRKRIGDFIEVYVAGGEAAGYEIPFYPEVAVEPGEDLDAAPERVRTALTDSGYVKETRDVYDAAEEARIKERLEKLGYL